MIFVVGSDLKGEKLKEIVKDCLCEHAYEVVDATEGREYDFVDATLAVVREVKKGEDRFGVVVDAYGAGPFMVASRIKGVIAAEVSDERTAYMTRAHNNLNFHRRCTKAPFFDAKSGKSLDI